MCSPSKYIPCACTPFPAVLLLIVAFLESSWWDVVEGLRDSSLDVFC